MNSKVPLRAINMWYIMCNHIRVSIMTLYFCIQSGHLALKWAKKLMQRTLIPWKEDSWKLLAPSRLMSKSKCLFLHQHFILSYTCFTSKMMMDGWMTCGFTSFSTVFQSYQGDWLRIIKGLVQWKTRLRLRRLRFERGSNPEPLDQ